MYDFRRHITTLCAAAGFALISGRAQAWIESEVRSHVATVDVDRAGKALVTEDLTLAVRGGPLSGFELSGVDLDAEPLPDASGVVGRELQKPSCPRRPSCSISATTARCASRSIAKRGCGPGCTRFISSTVPICSSAT